MLVPRSSFRVKAITRSAVPDNLSFLTVCLLFVSDLYSIQPLFLNYYYIFFRRRRSELPGRAINRFSIHLHQPLLLSHTSITQGEFRAIRNITL